MCRGTRHMRLTAVGVACPEQNVMGLPNTAFGNMMLLEYESCLAVAREFDTVENDV